MHKHNEDTVLDTNHQLKIKLALLKHETIFYINLVLREMEEDLLEEYSKEEVPRRLLRNLEYRWLRLRVCKIRKA